MILFSSFSILQFVILANICLSRKVVRLQVVDLPGSFVLTDGQVLPAVYLARKRLQAMPRGLRDREEFTLSPLLPVLLRPWEDSAQLLQLSRRTASPSTVTALLLGEGVRETEQDSPSLFDQLPFHWSENRLEKRDLRSCLLRLASANQAVAGQTNGYEVLCQALRERWQAEVVSLSLEVADRFPGERGGVVLGGVMRLSRSASSRVETDEGSTQTNSYRVLCSAKEVVLASLGLQMDVVISASLFDSLSVAAVARKSDNDDSSQLVHLTGRSATSLSTATSSVKVIKPWDITSAEMFLSLSVSDKREILRGVGETLPRPSEGEKALNALLLPLLLYSVRRSVLSEEGEDMQLEAEEEEEEAEMTASAAQLKADPTQDPGSYSAYLDQDEWYFEARRRAMRPRGSNSDD